MKFLNAKPAFLHSKVAHDLTFNSVFTKSYTGMVYFAFKILGDKQESEDVVQNAFITYWNRRGEVGEESNVIKGFLYTTVRNTCMDILKHRKVVQKFRDQLDVDPIEERDIVNDIIHVEVLSEIFNAIENLPLGCKKVLELSYLQGKKNQEISEEMGISINTVKTQKQRAIQLLRLKLTSGTFGLLLVLLAY